MRKNFDVNCVPAALFGGEALAFDDLAGQLRGRGSPVIEVWFEKL